jgi:ABC-2 type transport system permease protein
MKTIRYTLSVTWKEILLLSKDRGTLAIMLLLPLLLGSVFAGINLQLSQISEEGNILFDVHLVNQDAGAFGEHLEAALNEIDILNVIPSDSASDSEDQVAKGEVAAVIIVPESLSEDIDSYTPTMIEVIVDPAAPESASIISGILNQATNEITIWGEVQYGVRTILNESGVLEDASPEVQMAVAGQTLGAIMTQLNEMRRSPAILVDSKTLEGVTIEGGIEIFFAFLFPAFAVMFIFFIIGISARSLLIERETGTMRRMLAAPIPRGTVIAGKMLAFILLACLQIVILFAVGNLLFGMPLGESPLALVLLTLVTALVATAMGMLVAALSKSSKQADNIGIILAFVLAAIGGAMPISRIPFGRVEGFIGSLSQITPHAHAIEGYYRVMTENAGLGQVWFQIGILLVMGIVIFLVATWRFRFE